MKKKWNKRSIHHPHDKALFAALENHAVARDAMRAYLPSAILALADLNKIKNYKTKYVSPQYKEFEADVIYEIGLKDQSALLLFHCEHQSSVEKHMPLRVWQYLLLVLMEYAQNHPEAPLPLVYPIILYTGELRYNESTDFFDLFGEYKEIAKRYLLSPVHLVDVCSISDDDLKKHKLFGLTEYVFKHKKTNDFHHFLQEFLPWLSDVEIQLGREYARMSMKYVVDVYREADYTGWVEGVERYLSDELEGEAMTIAQQLKQQGKQEGMQQGMHQGIQQGMQQGMQQGRREEQYAIAQSMLRDKMPIEVVSKYTTLSIDEISLLLGDDIVVAG